MLGLQASNLEQQERLFKNQIRLGLREILQQELSFYNNAFNNISGCASILAGFSFTGLMLNPYDSKNELEPDWLDQLAQENGNQHLSRAIETCFNACCAVTTCLCLLTVVYSNYLGLFATRLALRGGEMAVEESVMRIRGEYKVVLYSLTASVECFILTLPVLAFYKMELIDAVIVSGICLPSVVLVLYLYRRARQLFYLDKDDRFAAAKKKRHAEDANDKEIRMSESARAGGGGGHGGRLSDIVTQLDGRNDELFDYNNSSHGQGQRQSSTSTNGGRGVMHRRSVSWDGHQASQYYNEGGKANGEKKAYWGFFKKKENSGSAGLSTQTSTGVLSTQTSTDV